MIVDGQRQIGEMLLLLLRRDAAVLRDVTQPTVADAGQKMGKELPHWQSVTIVMACCSTAGAPWRGLYDAGPLATGSDSRLKKCFECDCPLSGRSEETEKTLGDEE